MFNPEATMMSFDCHNHNVMNWINESERASYMSSGVSKWPKIQNMRHMMAFFVEEKNLGTPLTVNTGRNSNAKKSR